MSDTNSNRETGTKSVTVIGAGNIGSHLLPLIARMPAVRCVTVVDFDFYEEKNLVSQSIAPSDVGQPKAIRQAARLREINPRLSVTPIVARIENVPRGALRADVIAGCLDSRLSRRIASRIAWWLGVPYVDAGVQPDGKLARIHVYRPEADSACLECLWDEQDYQAEREAYSCDGTRIEAASTNAPASLGALASAMQAIEIEKILAGDWLRVAVGHEVMLDANSHRHFVSRLPRNAACRFDHRTITAREFPGVTDKLTLADLFATGADDLRVEGHAFAKHWACGSCHAGKAVFGLRDRITGSVVCEKCGHPMRAIGFHTHDRLTAALVPEGAISSPLSALGFGAGDIFSATVGGEEIHFEITTPAGGQP